MPNRFCKTIKTLEKIKDEEKINELASYVTQLIVDEIRIHRRNCKLDPVWYPDEKWWEEKFDYAKKVLNEVINNG